MFTQKECDQLNASKAQVKALWIRACIVEGIEPTSRFVIFSGDNQAANDHNQAKGVHFDLLQRIRKNEARRAKKVRR